MYRKHGSYYFVTRDNTWLNLGKDLAAAKRKWAELSGEKPAGGLARMMDRYLEEVASKKSPRTFADNKVEMANLRKVFGLMDPADVRPMHVAKYLDLRGESAPVRANREKALLSHLYTMMMRWGVVDSNPCRGVHRNPEDKRDRYITDEEFAAVWQQANPTVRCLMDLAYLTAQRIGDLITLRYQNVTATAIQIRQGKTGAKLAITISPALRELLERVRHLHPTVRGLYLFTTREGKPYTYDGISSMFKRAVAKAQLKDFHFHDIRAKAITDAKRAGLDAQGLAGHATETMTAHYVKLRELDEVAPLPGLVSRKSV